MSTTSDQSLITQCRSGCRDAWNEFFTRFTPLLSSSIHSSLVANSIRDSRMSLDDDIIWDIQEKLVIRFYKGGLLDRCEDITGIRSWLRTVAANQTRDWLKSKNRLKELPRKQFEANLESLDAQLFDQEGSDYTLHDFATGDLFGGSIENLNDSGSLKGYEVNRQYVDTVQHLLQTYKRSDKESDRRSYWSVRLNCLAPWPLTVSEIESLAEYSQMPFDLVASKIESLSSEMEKRDAQRSASLGRSVMYWHIVRHYEQRLAKQSVDDNTDSQARCDELRRKVAHYEELRQDSLKKGIRIPRPPNRDIAELIKLPVEQEGQVTVIIKRFRERFEKIAENFIHDAVT